MCVFSTMIIELGLTKKNFHKKYSNLPQKKIKNGVKEDNPNSFYHQKQASKHSYLCTYTHTKLIFNRKHIFIYSVACLYMSFDGKSKRSVY